MDKSRLEAYKDHYKNYQKLYEFLNKGITTTLDDFNLKVSELISLRKYLIQLEKKYPDLIKYRPKNIKL